MRLAASQPSPTRRSPGIHTRPTTTSHTGQQFAANTYRNKMKGLSGAIKYAIEFGRLSTSPLDRITKSALRKATTIDRRVVVNPVQARSLITVVKDQGQGRTGAHLTVFFAILYCAGLRPSEALALRAQECTLPKKGWGELCFAESSPTHTGPGPTTAATAPAKL